MKRYPQGLVVGKFYPPHAGHDYLIREAAQQCDTLTVLVEAATHETVPLESRLSWLRETHASLVNVQFCGTVSDVPVDLHDEQVWVAQVATMKAALRLHGVPVVHAVFSSEPYGRELAVRFEAEPVLVDVERRRVPVSGTACRNDLYGMWETLSPATQAGLACRIIVVGAESTGTTTVSLDLADHYRRRAGVWARTGWVPEYGREYTVVKHAAAQARARKAGGLEPSMTDLVWTEEDFRLIAEEQTRLENEAARGGSPLVVADTDAWATSVWEYRYLGAGSHGADEAAMSVPRRDIYLVTDHKGVDFEQDGIRDGEHIRAAMTGWFVDRLTLENKSWCLLTGTREERLRLAVRVTDQILSYRVTFTPPLG